MQHKVEKSGTVAQIGTESQTPEASAMTDGGGLPVIGEPSNIAACLRILQSISPDKLESDAASQVVVREASRKLTSLLSNPVSVVLEASQSPVNVSVVRMGLDLNIFSLLTTRGAPMTTNEIVAEAKVDGIMMKRILRALGSIGFVDEVDCDLWQSNRITGALSEPTMAAGFRYRWDMLIESAIRAPRFLRKTNYRNPVETLDGPFQLAHQTSNSAFDFLRDEEPDRLQDFNTWMGHTRGVHTRWVDWYPSQERLIDDIKPGRALFVDVGGGKGHDAQAFREKFPNAEDRLILQDLAQALDSITDGSLDSSIDRQVYDFFTPNPVRGARAYHLHHVLHDWSDTYCLKILRNTREAMEPGYSKLLIHELILPQKGVTTQQAFFDLGMMSINSGRERTRAEWSELLEASGFVLDAIWYGGNGSNADGIIEATPKS